MRPSVHVTHVHVGPVGAKGSGLGSEQLYSRQVWQVVSIGWPGVIFLDIAAAVQGYLLTQHAALVVKLPHVFLHAHRSEIYDIR